MDTAELVTQQKQFIARQEKSLAQEKLKKRRADTRRKIEYGGLVIKSAMNSYNKSVILGALAHTLQLINHDENYLTFFESIGDNLFLEK